MQLWPSAVLEPPLVGCGHKIVLCEGMSNMMTYLHEDMSYRSTYFTGGHFLKEDMSFRKMCLTGGIFYGRSCIMGGHALWEDVL